MFENVWIFYLHAKRAWPWIRIEIAAKQDVHRSVTLNIMRSVNQISFMSLSTRRNVNK